MPAKRTLGPELNSGKGEGASARNGVEPQGLVWEEEFPVTAGDGALPSLAL